MSRDNAPPRPIDESFFDTQPISNTDEIVFKQLKKQMYEYRIKTYETALEHHNSTYKSASRLFYLLGAISYIPLLIISWKVLYWLFCANGREIIESVSFFAGRGYGGLVLAALYIVPVFLLTRILKHTSITDTQQDSDSEKLSDMIPPLG